ncbi:MAG: phosphoribosylformylglycinamidine synthase subunit PurQ [Phycisphaerae bacterium]
MGDVQVIVLRAAGINCDEEAVYAWRLAGAKPALVHINTLARNPEMLNDYHIVTIPGGFSYGDDIAAGTILAQRIVYDLAEPLRGMVRRGGGILGICNGFQVLVKAGLLPGCEVDTRPGHARDASARQVTVTFNDSAKFEARWVCLRICAEHCVYLTTNPGRTRGGGGMDPGDPELRRGTTDGGSPADSLYPSDRERVPAVFPHGEGERPVHEPSDCPLGSDPRGLVAHSESDEANTDSSRFLEMPVEHAEGKVVTASDEVTRRLDVSGCVALRYVDAQGRYDRYPANPNGSVGGIAGLCDPTGRILGLMPHPDRHFDRMHHPQWTRRSPVGPPDGLKLFQNAVRYWSA